MSNIQWDIKDANFDVRAYVGQEITLIVTDVAPMEDGDQSITAEVSDWT